MTVVAILALAATGSAARANPAFSWNPTAVGLDGTRFSADTLLLGDYDRIMLGSDGTTFSEAGYLPVEGFQLGGVAVTPSGFDAGGAGWGAYVHYTASGTQTLSSYGTPQANYQQLSYEIVGFNGSATYGFDATGQAVVGGALTHTTTLESGSLVAGQLSFVPVSPTALAIAGSIQATIDEAKPQFVTGPVSGFDLQIFHPPADYAFTSPTTIQVAADSGATATILSGRGGPFQQSAALAAVPVAFAAALPAAAPAVAVPEPASLLLLGTGLAGLAALRRGRGRRAERGPAGSAAR